MSLKRLGVVAPLGAVMVLAAASPASAGHAVDRVIGSSSSGTLGGEFNQPKGIAANDATADGNGTDGWFYVADDNNHRIQAFNAAGDFQWAIGRNVSVSATTGDDSGAPGFAYEKCVTAADCQGGTSSAAVGGFVGTGAGMFDNPQAVAINQATGDFYVRDRDNRRVQQFTADGDFIRMWGFDVIVATGPPPNDNGTGFEVCDVTNGNVLADCKIGTIGTGVGQFGSSNNVAQNGIAVQQSTGDVFVVDPGNATGNRRVLKFEADGSLPEAIGASGAPFGANLPLHVAVDDGVVYAMNNSSSTNKVERYDLNGSAFLDPLLFPDSGPAFATAKGLAVGGASLFVANTLIPGDAGNGAAFEYATPGGSPALVDTHAAGLASHIGSFTGFGYNASSDELFFASTGAGHRVYIADHDGATPATVGLLPATAVGPDGATLHAEITSPDALTTSYRLEVSRDGSSWETVGSGTAPADTVDAPVSATATGLRPNTLYRFRVVTARQFGNPEYPSAELTFLTDAVRPEIADVRTASLGDTSVTLQGRVNPHSTPTSYRFEYGVGAFNRVVPLVDGSVGSGPNFVFVSERLTGLLPGTVYQYRLVATSATEGATVGDLKTFTTAAGPTSDGKRAYELVSPADKFSGIGVGRWGGGTHGAGGGSGEPAHVGERFAAQGNFGSILLDSASAYALDWAFADRTPAGWVSHSPITHAPSNSQHFRFTLMNSASEDLSRMVWGTNAGILRPFPELASWPSNVGPEFVGDWDGRWELLAPTDLDQMRTLSGGSPASVVSEDGSSVAFTTNLSGPGTEKANPAGLAGPGDPTGRDPDTGVFWPDLVAGRAAYLDDLSSELSDAFTVNGVYANVGVCADDTQIPARNGSGLLEDQSCAAPVGLPAGPDATLISPRGAALHSANQGTELLRNIVSRDGSRTFFLSPDPVASGVPTAGCSGTGASTLCTPQLYVRQRNNDGSVTTRWVSRAEDGLFETQAASLSGVVRFAGASEDGDRVFFQTNAPLTADDPNAGCGAPCLTGSPSNDSWDLYVYDLPDGPDDDPADGELTRVSAGPAGTGDCRVVTSNDGSHGSLRFAADDGNRAYFTCAAPLPGVSEPANGTVTAPGGTVASTDAVNLYAYENDGGSESWDFVARLPKTGSSAPVSNGNACATIDNSGTDSLLVNSSQVSIQGLRMTGKGNCVRGTADGAFVTFWTFGSLTADDPDTASFDAYAYDAESKDLTRITAPQGGTGESYVCNPYAFTLSGPGAGEVPVQCNGDPGFGGLPIELLGVVTKPSTDGDRIAFFQTRSRLVSEDTDNAYDVYQWRNGELSLVSTGASAFDGGPAGLGGAFYKGNDETGRNVYFATNDTLSWQDSDAVLDIYTARVDGGIPQPALPAVCSVLAGGCQDAAGGVGPVSAPAATRSPTPTGARNADPGVRATLRVGGLGAKARRRAGRTGVLALRVRTTAPGVVSVVARGKVGKRTRVLGRARKQVRRPGVTRVAVRLNKRARRAIGARRGLRLRVAVRQSGARPRSIAVRLTRGARS